MKSSSTALVLLVLSAALGAAAPALAWQPAASGSCLVQIHHPDWYWQRVCTDPADPTCPVYVEEQRGNVVTRECAVEAPLSASGVAWQPELPSGCIIEIHQADWSWYRTCIDASDVKCPVYTETQHGNSVTRSCVATVPLAASAAWQPEIPGESCHVAVKTHEWSHVEYCYNLQDASCPVYTRSVGAWGTSTRCVVETPRADASGVSACFPTSGNLEETYLCVDSSNLKCAVYTTGPAGTRCVTDLP